MLVSTIINRRTQSISLIKKIKNKNNDEVPSAMKRGEIGWEERQSTASVTRNQPGHWSITLDAFST